MDPARFWFRAGTDLYQAQKNTEAVAALRGSGMVFALFLIVWLGMPRRSANRRQSSNKGLPQP